MRADVLLLGLTVALGGTLAGCGGGSAQTAPGVLLLTLDTTRRDRLSCYGYERETSPHLDRLAARGTLFGNAYSSNPVTLPAHATILTGTYPFWHGVRDNGIYRLHADAETLAERLGREGYATGAVIAAGVLKATFGLDQGFEHYDDEVYTTFNATGQMPERPATAVTDAALAWLAQQEGRPFLLWVHYFDPHAPWNPPPDLARRFAGDPGTYPAYDAEVAYMDREIGRLLATLDGQGRLERTLVVAVADHGEGLMDHGEMTHGMTLYDEVLAVPMILAGPGVPAGERIDAVVRTVDIVPTVLGALGLPASGELHGIDLFEHEGGLPALDAYLETYTPETSFGWTWLEAVRRGEPPLKYIDAPRPEVYDLQEDPGELEDLSPEGVEESAAVLSGIPARLLEGTTPLDSAMDVTAEARSDLTELGYVGTATTERPATRGADMKDMLAALNKKEQATLLVREQDFDRAEALAREFLADVGRKAPGHELIALVIGQRAESLRRNGEADRAREETARALPHLQAVVDLAPGYVSGRYNYARALQALGMTEEGVAQLEVCVAQDPGFQPPNYLLGQHHFGRGEYERALPYYQNLVEAWNPAPGARSYEGVGAQVQVGLCKYMLGAVEEGRRQVQRAREMAPEWPEPVYWLGWIAYDQGQREEAKRLLSGYVRTPGGSPQLVARARGILSGL